MSRIIDGIPMTKENRLNILTRAYEILSNPTNWTTRKLRTGSEEYGYSYCMLGACEQAVYDLGLAVETEASFDKVPSEVPVDAYNLGTGLSLEKYVRDRYGYGPVTINDADGYRTVMEAMHDYIEQVKEEEESE